MDPEEQQNQGKECVEWSEEAKENMLKLILMLMEMEEEQKHMTEEEKERNAIGFTCKDGKFVYFNYYRIYDYLFGNITRIVNR